jgi:hypothetical protein
VYFSIFMDLPSLGLRTRPEGTEERIVMGVSERRLDEGQAGTVVAVLNRPGLKPMWEQAGRFGRVRLTISLEDGPERMIPKREPAFGLDHAQTKSRSTDQSTTAMASPARTMPSVRTAQ